MTAKPGDLFYFPKGSAITFSTPDFGIALTVPFLSTVFSITLISSIESLLSIKAVDKLDPQKRRSNVNKDLIYKIKTVDIALTVRSTKNFFRNSKIRDVFALKDSTRNKKKTDKYLRDTIIVTAHARNLGME